MNPLQTAQDRLQAAQAQLDAAQANFDRATSLLASLVAFNLALMAGLCVHEAGHAMMARRAGLAIRMIRIGRGPVVVRRRFGQTWLVVRLKPVSGQVTVLLPFEWQRWQAVSFLLGGIVGNSVLLALSAGWLAFDHEAAWWTLPIILAQGLEILSAMVPRTWTASDGMHHSDGERLRRYLRDPAGWSLTQAQARLARRLGITSPLPAPSPALPEIVYQLSRPERLKESWARRDVNRVLRDLLARPTLTWFERSTALDELALLEVHHGDGLVTDQELDGWSAELLARAPTEETKVLRAGALVRLGRLDEADALLGPPGTGGGSRPHYKDLVAAHLRLARARAALHQPV